jgi:hypothetical protein
MSRRWEYMQIVVNRDPGQDKWPVTLGYFQGAGEFVPLPTDDIGEVLDSFGLEGWELVGPPETQHAVAGTPSFGGAFIDRAFWVERRFWLKRELS